MFRQRLSDSRGSTLVELVIWVSLLLMPIGPGLALYAQLSDQLAAESIARNALRFAILSSTSNAQVRTSAYQQAAVLAQSWGKRLGSVQLRCSGSCPRGNLLHLEVVVGNAKAIQTSALR
jgi:hypothetical protein